MPESKIRNEAKRKRLSQRRQELQERRHEKALSQPTRNWVPWVFVPVGILGALWMVTYNLAGSQIGLMRSLGDWNVLIGMGLIVAAFALMTLWK